MCWQFCDANGRPRTSGRTRLFSSSRYTANVRIGAKTPSTHEYSVIVVKVVIVVKTGLLNHTPGAANPQGVNDAVLVNDGHETRERRLLDSSPSCRTLAAGTYSGA
jgi:hypothetical protein